MIEKGKDPFAGIDDGEKDKMNGMTNEELKGAVQKAAMDEVENIASRDADQQLAEAKQAVKDASEQYREASKRHKSVIAYAKSLLEARGAR